mmetsp:Transcript_5202/g.7646  ORF Transcript_5202/g.7646 Transcript_5202/m.7646 type:complete len:314 (-) Transcript_5202:71-1012(-)
MLAEEEEDEVAVEVLLRNNSLVIVGTVRRNTSKTLFLLVTPAVVVAVEADAAVDALMKVADVAVEEAVVEEEMMVAEEVVTVEEEVAMGQTSVSVQISSGKKVVVEITGTSNKGADTMIKDTMKAGMGMTHGATMVVGMMDLDIIITGTNHITAVDGVVDVAEEGAEEEVGEEAVVVGEEVKRKMAQVMMLVELQLENKLQQVTTELKVALQQKEQEMLKQLQDIPLLSLPQPSDVAVEEVVVVVAAVVGVTTLRLPPVLHPNSGSVLDLSLQKVRPREMEGMHLLLKAKRVKAYQCIEVYTDGDLKHIEYAN